MNTYSKRISEISSSIVRCVIGETAHGLLFLKNNLDRKDLKIKDIVPVNHPSFNEEYNELYCKMYTEIADTLNKYLVQVEENEIKE